MISLDKTYQTANGRDVRIYATDAGGQFPVHGASLEDDQWFPRVWAKDGTHVWTRDHDLIEVKPRLRRTVWAVHYKETGAHCLGRLFSSEESAKKWTEILGLGPHFIERIEADW